MKVYKYIVLLLTYFLLSSANLYAQSSGGGTFGDDGQSNSGNGGGSGGSFGDSDQQNPSTEGGSGGFGDGDMNNPTIEGNDYIIFADANVKALCVANWDTNGDGELSEEEAAAVTDLGTVFKGNTTITSFNELQYFTGLTSIGERTFYRCSRLTSVTIPNSVTSIGNFAFEDCSSLTSINIPNSVTSIGSYAFTGCSSLTSVVSEIETPFTFGSYAFSVSSVCVLTVPAGKRESYINAGWTTSVFMGGIIDLSDPSAIYVETGCLFQAKTIEGIDMTFRVLDATLNTVQVGNNGCSINSNTAGDVTIPNKVVYGGKEYSVTSIGNYAFQGCKNLTSVTIPNGVTSIGNQAFYKCSGLTSVTIPNGVTSIDYAAFENCSSLTSVTIPNSVTNIGDYAFENCSSLTSVTILNSVTSIGKKAFYGCIGLTSVTIPANVTSLGARAFERCSNLKSATVRAANFDMFAFVDSGLEILYIGKEVSSMTDGTSGSKYLYPFANLKQLVIEDGDNDLTVGTYNSDTYSSLSPFYESSLETVYIGRNIKNIYWLGGLFGTFNLLGSADMRYDDKLTSLSIGYKVTSIPDYMCSYCIGLTSIAIPNGVTSIGNGAFGSCTNLASITIPNSLISVGDYAFHGTAWYNNKPDGINYVGKTLYSYKGTMPENTMIVLDEGTIKIAAEAFYGCTGLTSVTIPNSVTSISQSAFRSCSGLTSVKVDISSPISISNGTFSNQRNVTLYVPYGRKAAYQAASYWQDFKDIIEFIEGDVNSDYETDVVDVVDIARFVVGTPAETFVEILADINRDGGVNIGDAVALVNEIAGDQNFVKELHTSRRSATSANEDMLTLEETGNGIALVLMNQRDYTAFQFDLYVPEETDVAQMLLNSQRKQKHQLLYNKVEEGHYRVVALSTSNRTFMGNSGELLSFALNSVSDGDIAVRNILFYDVEGDGYTFDDLLYGGTATEIADTQSAIPTDGKYHTIDGRLIGDKPTTKGIYIVNGKKVMVK